MVGIDYAFLFDKICEGGKHKTHLCIPLRQGTARDWRGVPKFMDEATSGLDPVTRSEILDILLDFIQDEEHSVLLSSHITSDLEKIADYITFIHDGRILFSESKDELLTKYGLLKCGKEEFSRLDKSYFEGYRESSFGAEALIRNRDDFGRHHPSLTVDDISIEDIMVFYGKKRED